MHTLKARVRAGRLVLDEPTRLPEGTEIELAPTDARDDLDAQERAALHTALADAFETARRGKAKPAKRLVGKLRKRA